MSDLESFQLEVRNWLEANCPLSLRKKNRSAKETIFAGRNKVFPNADAEQWFERMRDKHWIRADWPAAYGGADFSREQFKILEREMARLHCPPPIFDLGQTMFGPVIMEYGNETQKREHLTRIANGEVRWCQGYSEPGAGSDLASLKCKAEDMGDHFLVNGSKIWTTNADLSDWIFCLVRTDFEAPKHNGISVLLIDMETAGITTKPIKLISGESEFCETFFDNVKVPKGNLLGDLNRGWAIAKRVLEHERAMMSGDNFFGDMGPDIVALARQYVGVDSDGRLKDPVTRRELARHLMHTKADTLSGMRLFLSAKARMSDDGLASTMKYSTTGETQRKNELVLSMLGNRGLSWEDDEFSSDEQYMARAWAFEKSYTIAGGSSEVQLNILAKRVLGLPDK